MSLDREPLRWSDPNSDVPDVLRELMQAGAQDLPTTAKMAALGAKVAATTAATTATGGGIAAISATKLWVAGVGLGLVVLGGTVLFPRDDQGAPSRAVAPGPAQEAPPAAVPTPTTPAMGTTSPELHGASGRGVSPMQPGQAEPAPSVRGVGTAPLAPATGQPVGTQGGEQSGTVAEGPAAPASAEPSVDAVRIPQGKTQGPRMRAGRARNSASRTPQHDRRPSQDRTQAQTSPATAERSETATEGEGQISEMSLLLQARRALASSPRRALGLARQHAEMYPHSQFAQERDALEIEALTRAGRLDQAREAARRFVSRFPNSAHAHRFRERLEL